MVKTGEKPGVGTYTCTRCGTKVEIKDAGEALPKCPKCGNDTFTRD